MFAGIGENTHLAFNDPPADFDTTDPYIVVKLDEACRRQQVGEGWFARVEDVPETAISISIQQILKAREILVMVPDARKADAVKATLEGEVSPAVPASILRTHRQRHAVPRRARGLASGPRHAGALRRNQETGGRRQETDRFLSFRDLC